MMNEVSAIQYAVLLAGGSGQRMNSGQPKQFLLLNGKPVLQYSLQHFYNYNAETKIIVVLPANEIDSWKKLLAQNSCMIPHQIVEGGSTRFESVVNALKNITADGIVAIHDGVRPLISVSLIERCMTSAVKFGNGIPCLPLNESIRQLENGSSKAVDRSKFVQVQTPQCFRINLIKKAYEQPFQPEFTDDASVFEKSGEVVHLVDGEQRNIKITYPGDLELAEMIIRDSKI